VTDEANAIFFFFEDFAKTSKKTTIVHSYDIRKPRQKFKAMCSNRSSVRF